MQGAAMMLPTLKECIQDARRLLAVFEEHGIDEVESGSPESRDSLLKACSSDLALLLRRLSGISTARLASLVAAPLPPPQPAAESPAATAVPVVTPARPAASVEATAAVTPAVPAATPALAQVAAAVDAAVVPAAAAALPAAAEVEPAMAPPATAAVSPTALTAASAVAPAVPVLASADAPAASASSFAATPAAPAAEASAEEPAAPVAAAAEVIAKAESAAPPSAAKTELSSEVAKATEAPAAVPTAPAVAALVAAGSGSSGSIVPEVGRGQSGEATTSLAPPPKKRGRPRKVPLPELDSAPAQVVPAGDAEKEPAVEAEQPTEEVEVSASPAAADEAAGEGAKEEHRCQVCQKTFGSRAGLVGHVNFSVEHQQRLAQQQTEATNRVLSAAGESFERVSGAPQQPRPAQDAYPSTSPPASSPSSSCPAQPAPAAVAADEAAAPVEKRRRISVKSSGREKPEAMAPQELEQEASTVAPSNVAASGVAATVLAAPLASAQDRHDQQAPSPDAALEAPPAVAPAAVQAPAAPAAEEAVGTGSEEGAAEGGGAAEAGEATPSAQKAREVPARDQFDKFPPATDHDIELFPSVCAAFEVYLRTVDAKINENTRRTYPPAIQTLFRLDGKPPEVMATDEYRVAVKHTLEDRACSHIQSAALRYFGQFWDVEGKEFCCSGQFPAEVTEELKSRYQKKHTQPLARIRLEEDGDGSEEARKAESLPEGWKVHSTSGGRILGYSSPEGVLYTSRGAVRQLFEGETPAPKSRRRGAALGEGEEADDADAPTPDKPVVDPKPLLELLGTATEADVAGPQDRQFLPRIIATFGRHMREQRTDTQRQSTRDAYVLAVFKLFSLTGRGFHAMAQTPFLEAVAGSEEARKNKALNTAVRTFRVSGGRSEGYSGSFDEADRDSMNLALNVKPILTDGNGECCAPMHGGRSCQRPNQQCNTCGTKLKCSIHGDHSVLECREIFWAKHSKCGTRQRTMADFWKAPVAASSSQEAQDGDIVTLEA
eukprot:CAMPEP_0115175216 /NCGR_PEP_ID=MMETSP0270-20121206/4244_1 /TAXON_ID=71861 /ORGANISM="Scrippsiella trochoidea, Strain CCMP3099" /LENGTH=1005 /DNA_ID=CAMNT_0002588087 /DNA_START=65 /DNA_END=3083 /DNA_ORIENTATION=+